MYVHTYISCIDIKPTYSDKTVNMPSIIMPEFLQNNSLLPYVRTVHVCIRMYCMYIHMYCMYIWQIGFRAK